VRLRLHGGGITVASIFWGLWLFPFGMLVIGSGFIPIRVSSFGRQRYGRSCR
jgi:hypothetical protein